MMSSQRGHQEFSSLSAVRDAQVVSELFSKLRSRDDVSSAGHRLPEVTRPGLALGRDGGLVGKVQVRVSVLIGSLVQGCRESLLFLTTHFCGLEFALGRKLLVVVGKGYPK